MTTDRSSPEPSHADVLEQRDRIVSSKLFALSKRLQSFLIFIVDATLKGEADRLKEFTLGIEVFERDESFDPSIDSIVRVEASRLRSKLREYYDAEGKDDPIRIDIPKGHYVPVFRFIASNRGEIDDEQNEEATSNTVMERIGSGKLGLVIVALVVAIIMYVVANKTVMSPDALNHDLSVDDMTVAVLPFVPLSSGTDDSYFADGLTEEILNSLARAPDLRVTARTSSFYFKDKNVLIPDIAAQLGVAHVVEGSVRRDGDQLRITAQLIRGTDNFHLWSQSYDRPREDVFGVQEEIAEKIAEVLGVVLDDEVRDVMHSAGINDVEAFIAYQKGQEAFYDAHQGMNMSDALALANTHFDAALDSAPGITSARLMKADLRGHILFEIIAGVRRESYSGELEETLDALREEYRLAADLSPAGHQQDILNLERTLFSNNWGTLPARIGKAMQLGECAQMNWTNAFISPFGWANQLSEMYGASVVCDPLDTSASFHLAWTLIWAGKPAEALLVIEDAERKGLSHPFLDDGRFWALLAINALDHPDTFGPGTGGGNIPFDRRILREARAGNLAAARDLADVYWSGSTTNDYSSLIISAVIGDRAKANEIATRIDALPGSVVVLGSAIFTCHCGAPFDLDATPNYKARVQEARLPWPPPTNIEYPAKTW